MSKTGFLTTIRWISGILLLSTGCRMLAGYNPTPTPLSIEQLIAILEAGDPNSPNYKPGSEEFAAFGFAIAELAKLGPAAAPAAPALARALQYPRRDSYMACKALIAIGPAAAPAIPELLKALKNKNDYPLVRQCAALVLGIIGEPAKCVVPEIAPLLWDSKHSVRVTAAMALDAITGKDLVDQIYKIDPSHVRIVGDPPLGEDFDDSHIISKARAWWIEEGQHLDWLDKSNPCNPSSP